MAQTGQRQTINLDNWSDAQEMQREHPGTFEAPTVEEIRAIRKGKLVKISNQHERFWVIVTDIGWSPEANAVVNFAHNTFRGTVDNYLLDSRGYDYGDTVEFEGRHIYAIG